MKKDVDFEGPAAPYLKDERGCMKRIGRFEFAVRLKWSAGVLVHEYEVRDTWAGCTTAGVGVSRAVAIQECEKIMQLLEALPLKPWKEPV